MALAALDISDEFQAQIFNILSGILRLGNITFEGGESARVSNPQGENKNKNKNKNKSSHYIQAYL